MEPSSENLEASHSFHGGLRQESVPAREPGSLTAEGLERIYDLKQADRFLKSVGSGLPVERKQELDKSLSLHLEEQVGWSIGAVTPLIDSSERSRMTGFLAKWDSETPEAKNRRISTAIELFGDEKLDPKALEAKRQSFVNDIARSHEAKTHQNVKALSDKEIREWDELRTRQELKPVDQQRLRELEGRAVLERDKALGAIGRQQGPVPLLVNPEIRKRYEQLLKDQKATEKIKTLQVRLQIGKGPETQAKEAPMPLTHESLQQLLLQKTEDIKKTLTSGDYRLSITPMHSLKYAEEQLIPTITEANNDLDGTLRLIQSIMDIRKQFVRSSEDAPRVGALRELAGMLPRQETTGSKGPSLSEAEFSQRELDLSQKLKNMIDVVIRPSSESLLWTLPKQHLQTSQALLEEVNMTDVNQGRSAMIRARFNTVESHINHVKGLLDSRR